MLLTLWLYAISIGIKEDAARSRVRIQSNGRTLRWIVGRSERRSRKAVRVPHRSSLPVICDKAVHRRPLGTLLHRRSCCRWISRLQDLWDARTRSASAPSRAFRRRRNLSSSAREQAALHLKAVLAEADDP